MNLLTRGALCALAFVAINATAADDQLAQVIAGDQRSAANKARDPYRKPAEVLAFLGLRADMTVVEMFPSSGWYTEILGPYLKDRGKLIAVLNDRNPATQSPGAARRNKAFEENFAAKPELFGQISLGEASDKRLEIAADGTVDLILDTRNAHNWTQWGADAVAAAWFKALKSGGTVGLVDHRAGVGETYDPKSGYIHEQTLIALMERHGFKLADKSELLANPKDDHQHPEGVWTLPPTLALGEKDAEIYKAIGESDRMLLKFVKP